MAEKHIVVQGAKCQCKFSETPQTDNLKVLTNQKEYANDKDGSKKLIASTKEIGQTLEKNTFGKCKLQPTTGGFLPCIASIIQWSNFYEKTTLTNGGKILTEESKATCPIGGPDCISIKHHGQKSEPSQQNAKNASQSVHNQLNPLVDLKKVGKKNKIAGSDSTK